MIPDYTKEAIDNWVKFGFQPGSFVQAVLENNLSSAFGYADDNNTRHMKDIVMYVYNEVPSPAWGSPEKVDEWPKRLAIAKRAMSTEEKP